jgi:hypothetical protein
MDAGAHGRDPRVCDRDRHVERDAERERRPGDRRPSPVARRPRDRAGHVRPRPRRPSTRARSCSTCGRSSPATAACSCSGRTARPREPVAVRYGQAAAAGVFAAPRTLISANTGRRARRTRRTAPSAPRSSSRSPPGVAHRSASSCARPRGPGAPRVCSARRARASSARSASVWSGRGRVVPLWGTTRARRRRRRPASSPRSSSSTNPLSTYYRVTQRSNDRRCSTPALALSSSGDGFGSWLCSTSSSGRIDGPRLARLTAPS